MRCSARHFYVLANTKREHAFFFLKHTSLHARGGECRKKSKNLLVMNIVSVCNERHKTCFIMIKGAGYKGLRFVNK